MLIVYQSLESTGTKQDVSSTFITGNSFKKKVHSSLTTPLKSSIRLTKSVSYSKSGPIFTTTKRSSIATDNESLSLSRGLKKKSLSELQKSSTLMLTKIVENIVHNAASCTRPNDHILAFVRPPDIIVLGEMYASALMGKVIAGYVVTQGMNPTGDARHRFMVLVRTSFDNKTPFLGYESSVEVFSYSKTSTSNKNTSSKCMMIKIRGWLVAFVHIPNAICNKGKLVAQYLHNNVERVQKGGKLDLIMGDTNQSSSGAITSYMNTHYNRIIYKAKRKWTNSIMSDNRQVVRGYSNYLVSGTNSTHGTHYDIACTPLAHVKLSGLETHSKKDDQLRHTSSSDDDPVFIFHGLTDKFIEWGNKLYAYSDHNGVIVEILRDKPKFHLERRKAIREERIRQHKRRRIM